MTAPAILAARMEFAHQKALEVVEEYGAPERIENLQAVTVAQATASRPYHLASFQAELIASLAEIVEGQARTIADLKFRIDALEATPAASAEKPAPAKKAGKKA